MMTTCLDDETVLGMIEGRLAQPALAAVDDHLDGCPSCRDVIAQLARTRSPAHVLERGHTIGRYVIGELLGTGAMGRVYSAWEPELDRRVAIKVLHEDAPGGRDRLVREAQAMARLDHPNVVGVHEVGTTDDGVYVAMDLVEGETLRAWAERPRPWREVVRLLIDVARGLAAVHAAGVIHRDIKPDNVIVGADGRARLGDFGLARSGRASPERLAPRSPTDEPIAAGTPGTAVAGTPAYMAPEVLRGATATAASDQFSFGITAYEVLGGRRPFPGRTWAELASAIDRGSIGVLRSVPAWLDTAIRRCLAADPARRATSLAAIADVLANQSQRRRPARWIATALAAAAIASGVTWMATRNSPEPTCQGRGAQELATVWSHDLRAGFPLAGAIPAIDRWTATWASERDATCEATRVEPAPKIAARQRCLEQQRSELAALVQRARTEGTPSQPGRPEASVVANVLAPVLAPVLAIDEPPGSLNDRLADALAALSPRDCQAAEPGTADPLPLDPDRAAAAREVREALPAIRAAIAFGDARPAIATVDKLVERARTSGHAPTLAEALLVHADAMRTTARLADAALAARDAVVAAERGHDDQAAARAWIARVTVAGERRDLAVAEDMAAIATAAIDRAGAPPQLATQLLRLRALVAYNRGQLDETRALLLDARARLVALSSEHSREVAAIDSSLGTTARATGDLDAAERYHRKALAIDRELRPDGRNPEVARDLHNVAGVLRLRGDLAGAYQMYHQALAIEIAIRGEHGVEAGLTHNSLGLVKMAQRDWAGARVELEHALAALTAAGHGDRAFAEHNLGLVAAATGNHQAALEHYQRASAIYAATIGDDAMSPIRLYLDRARSIAARAGIAAARPDARRALDAARRAHIPWIAEDAQALLDDHPSPSRGDATVVLSIEPPVGGPIVVTQPARADTPPVPTPTPRPTPTRDVGTYGASQGW